MSPEIWLPTAAALGGALIGSLSPIVVNLLNAKAEGRRERLRLAVQLGIEDHRHQVTQAQRKANESGVRVGVSPISAIVAYHAEVLELYQDTGKLEPQDFVRPRERQRVVHEELAREVPRPHA